jgi:hypothetical protein
MSLFQSFDATERRTTKKQRMVQRTRLKLENLKILKAQCCPRRLKVENPNPIKDMHIWTLNTTPRYV